MDLFDSIIDIEKYISPSLTFSKSVLKSKYIELLSTYHNINCRYFIMKKEMDNIIERYLQAVASEEKQKINGNKKDIMNRCPLCESYNTNVTYGGGIFKTTHQFLTCNDCNHIETRELENK
jgi:hypothetical protein